MTSENSRLIIVYNANGGWLNALGDMVHKIVSPETYPCSLCALTYGAMRMRSAWRRFLAETGLPPVFLYRDEFRSDLDSRDIALPAILLGAESDPPQVLVDAEELGSLPDLPALIELVGARLRS